MSATVVGTSNFLSKLGQSIAPILGFSFMIHGDRSTVTSFVALPESLATMWWLVILVPTCVSFLQIMLWRWYTLRGNYLIAVREDLAQSTEAEEEEHKVLAPPPPTVGPWEKDVVQTQPSRLRLKPTQLV